MKEETKNLLNIYDTRAKEIKERFQRNGHIELQYYKELKNYKNFLDLMNEEEFNEILKNKRNRKARRKRANNKLKPLLEANKERVVFGTCTFSNNQFYKKNGKEIKEIERTKKINQWLKKHFKYSVVNIDYGEKNEREHHHFIGELNDDVQLIPILNKNGKQKKSKKGNLIYNLNVKDYKLGFEPDIEIIKFDTNDYYMKKVSNYLLKINNHINKKTTKNRRFRIIKK